MLRLKKRGSLWYICGTLAGGGRRIRKSTGTDDKVLAERILAREFSAQVEQSHGLTPREHSTLTLEEAYRLAWRLHPGWIKAKGPQAIEFSWAHVREFFGPSREVRTLAQRDLDEFFAAQQRLGAADSSLNSRMGVLSIILRYAQERGAVAPGLKPRLLPRTQEGRMRVVSGDEEQRVVAYFRERGDHDMADLVEFLLETGMRLQEALNLRGTDINLATRLAHVWTSKAGVARSTPLTEHAMQTTLRRLGGTLDAHRVFGDSLQDRYVVDRRWSRMRAALGLAGDKQFVVHALRHTCGTRLLEATGNLKLVQSWLGHEDIQTTLRYAHMTPGQFNQGIAALEQRRTAQVGRYPPNSPTPGCTE